MTPLGRKLCRLIEANGPISIAEYFSLCLSDPEHGYYQTHEPFGTEGDFTTAPEISQLFGEMIGIFLILAWQAHGRPEAVQLLEIGPGRGTLMADAQRVMQQLAPDMASSAKAHMIETSQRLQQVQRQTLSSCPIATQWHERLEDVPAGFTLLVANELFDALPIRQFVQTPDGFRERVVALDASGALHFQPGLAKIDPQLLPRSHQPAPGTVFEIAPTRQAIMAQIAGRLVSQGGAALIIDYGHLQTAFGDTLQAMAKHQYMDVLAAPGQSDLTSHVDFDALSQYARQQGAVPFPPMPQGRFLLELGLLERAGILGAGKDATVQDSIQRSVARLAGSQDSQMGNLFKALCVNSNDTLIFPYKSHD